MRRVRRVQLKIWVTDAEKAVVLAEAARRDLSLTDFVKLALREAREHPGLGERVEVLEGAVEDLSTRLARLEDMASGSYT